MAGMRVSWSDVQQLIALALGGAVLASGVGIGDLYARKKMQIPTFVQNTKALKSDGALCTKLAALGKDVLDERHVLHISFLRVVNHCDEIVFTYQEFQKLRSDPNNAIDKAGFRKVMLGFWTTLDEECIPKLIQMAGRQESMLHDGVRRRRSEPVEKRDPGTR